MREEKAKAENYLEFNQSVEFGASKERITEAKTDIDRLRDRAADIFMNKDKDYVARNHEQINKIAEWIRRNS